MKCRNNKLFSILLFASGIFFLYPLAQAQSSPTIFIWNGTDYARVYSFTDQTRANAEPVKCFKLDQASKKYVCQDGGQSITVPLTGPFCTTVDVVAENPPPPPTNYGYCLGQPTNTHDLDDNMVSDIAWRNANGDAATWLMTVNQSGAVQVLSAADYGVIDNNWQIVGQRDFNGDGMADLLWSNTNGDTSIWLMNGTQVSSALDLGFAGNGWSVVGTGDFNGDGFGDILWRNTNGDTSVWLMTGGPTQVSVLSTTDLGLVPTSWSVAQTGDFNGDGKSDILWRNTNGDTSVWLMTVSGTQMQVLSATDLGVVPASWAIAGTGDFNADSKSDIVWYNSNGDISIWLITASGTQVQVLSTTDLGVVPAGWNVALTGDFNGDGRSDILWRNSNGDTSIWFMNGASVSSTSGVGVVPASWTVQAAGAE
jgi:hypothetical protein